MRSKTPDKTVAAEAIVSLPAAIDRRELLAASGRALAAAEAVLRLARARVLALVAPKGAVDPALIDREQMAVHGFAWMATYVEALRQSREWALRLAADAALGEPEALIVAVAFGEYQIGRAACRGRG